MNNETKSLAIIPRTVDEIQTLAEVLAKSSLMPDALKGKVPDVVVSILAGQELGLSPMAAIRGVHVVQGKSVLSADTMVGLVLSSGLAEYFICTEESPERVTYETKRKGAPAPQRASWSRSDTKAAGLNTKDNWRLYERQMMKARAKAILARDAYPDVLAGTYDPDEMQVPATRPAIEVIDDAEIIPESDMTTRIDAANTIDDLKALVPELSKLKGDVRKAAKSRYDERHALLSKPTNGVEQHA